MLFQIPVPKTSESAGDPPRLWDVTIADESLDIASDITKHLVYHALKQKLGDATSGTKQGAESIAAVTKRMLTVLTVPTEGADRARGPRKSALETAVCETVAAILRTQGWKSKAIADATRTQQAAFDAWRPLAIPGIQQRDPATKTDADLLSAAIAARWQEKVIAPSEARVAAISEAL